MAASLLPNGEQQFIDGNGVPYAGGFVYFYIPSTSTLKNTWQDAAEMILNTNPVVLDGAGRAIIYGDGVYRQVLQDSLGNTIWDQETTGLSNDSITLPENGGTGIANDDASTITINGAFPLDLTLTAATAVTLPTSGTLATLSGTETLDNKTLTDTSSIAIGTSAASPYPLKIVSATGAQAYFGSTGSNNVQVILDTVNTGQEIDITFDSAGVQRWSLVKDTGDSFLLYDRVSGVAFIEAIAGGGGSLVLNSGTGLVSVAGTYNQAASYYKTFGNMIEQAGEVSLAGGGSGNITFPLAFPTTFVSAALTIVASTGSPTSSIWITGISNSGVTMHNGNGAAISVCWMARGF
jgi:hypothetical protein